MRNTKKLAALTGGLFSGFFSGLFLLFIFTFLLFSSCASSPVGSVSESVPVPEKVQPNWQPLEVIGLDYFAGKISSPKIKFHSLRIDLSAPELQIFTAGGMNGTKSTKVSTFVRDNNLLAGINALPFDPVSGKEGEPRTNIGLVIANGKMISPPYSGFDALVFYTSTDNSSVIAAIVPQSKIQSAENIQNAVGGFHRILEANEHVPRVVNLSARHPRSAAGISQDGRFLYLLVIDGRRPGSIGATEKETAMLLQALGASEGINFDGGGSSALAIRSRNGKVKVLNKPIHGGIIGKERAVAGCLGIMRNEE